MSNPQALTLTHALDLDDARNAARRLAEVRITARRELDRLTREAAEKKREFRKAKAKAYLEASGSDAHARKADVEARAADAEFEMTLAEGLVKVQQEKLEEIDGERASLHRLMEWSMKVDPLSQQQPAKYPSPIGAAGVFR